MYSNEMRTLNRRFLKKASLVAIAVEAPLFLSLLVSVFVFQKGPHTLGSMILYFSQFPAVIIVSLIGSLDSSEPTRLAIVWIGILLLQFSLFTIVIYLMLKATKGED